MSHIKNWDKEDIEKLTADDVHEIALMARDVLGEMIATDGDGEWYNDGGDYMWAATENWHFLASLVIQNPHLSEYDLDAVREWLTADPAGNFPLLGSDGEVRYDILSQDYIEHLYERSNA